MTIRSTSLRQNPAYRPGNSHSLVYWILLVAGMAACRAHVPEQVLSAPRPAEPRSDAAPRFWMPRPGVLTNEYVVEQRARIVTTTDSGTVDDSVSLVAAVAVRSVAGSGLAGLLREISIAAPGATATAVPGLALPYAFSAPAIPLGAQYAPTGQPSVADPCASPAHAALASVRDVLIRVPDSLYVGVTWSDSGTSVTCRDGVRLSLHTRRQFHLTDFRNRADGPVLLVTRTATTTLGGATTRGTDTTRVDGTGSSLLHYELDASTGGVVSASGSGSVDIVVRGAVRAQHARQTSTIRVSPYVARPY